MEGKDGDDDGHTHCDGTREDNPKTRPSDHHIRREEEVFESLLLECVLLFSSAVIPVQSLVF